MSLDLKEVQKAARLARISIQDKELEAYSNEINKILTWIEQLNQVDTSNTKPISSVIQSTTPLRDDVVEIINNRDDILKNAPKTTQGFYAVPKVVE